MLLCGLLLLNCEATEQNPTLKSSLAITSPTIAVPTLLQRHERIQQGKEWEQVQNHYANFKQKITAGDQEALLNLAQLFTQEARVTGEHGHYYPAALDLLEQILKSKDLSKDLKFRTLSTKAGVQLSQHEFEEALTIGEAAVQLNPYNAQIYGVLTDAYVELGDYEKAVAAADKMVQIRPDLRSYARISYLREIYGDVEGAIEAMKMAVQAGFPGQEEMAWTQLELGHLYARYGQLEQAEQQYQAILVNRPDYPFAIAALGEIAMTRNELQLAENYLKEAMSIIPEVGYYEQLARVYKKTNRTAELNDILKEIEVMLQDDVDSGHNMNLEYAAIYRDLYEDYDKALAYTLTEYQKRPNNIDTNIMLASIYAEKGQMEVAKKHLTQGSITKAQYPELLDLWVTLLSEKAH